MEDDGITFSSEELGRAVTEDEMMNEIREDFEEDNAEEEESLREDLESEGYVPQQDTDLSPVAFLERNINRADKISVANLTQEELGRPTLPVRFWRQFASLFDGETLFDMPLVYNHLLKKAQINEATSLSRDSKALELAFTSKRVRERKSGKAVSDFIDHIKKREGGQ